MTGTLAFLTDWFQLTLKSHPELALFFVLALGHALGRLRIGPVKLNAVIGILIAGVVVGQIGIEVPESLQWAFFLLFLFSLGYKIGPQFFRSLGRGALPQAGLAVLLCGSGLVTAYAVARIFGFDAGAAAGLIAGGLNASTTLGTANAAIAKLAVDPAVRQNLASSVGIAFAVTYLIGLVTMIGTLVKFGPWLMRVDLRTACRQLEAELGMESSAELAVSAYQEFVSRSYTLPADFQSRTVAELEAAFEPERVFVERVRTAQGVQEVSTGQVLHPGDAVVLSGRARVLVEPNNPLKGCEVDDPELLDIPTVTVDHVLTRRDLRHRTLADVVGILNREADTRGVFLHKISRMGNDLPIGPGLSLERGDVLTLVGARHHVERLAARLGSVEWPSPATDMVTLAAAITIGGLIGLPALRLAGIDLGLSLPVGVLLGGLLAGWLRSVRPGFGRVPEPALWLMDSLGLTAFLAVVAIGAGPSFVQGVKASGPALLVSGVLVCAVPTILTILVGRYVLRLHPGVLLGICAGGGTSPAALAALQEAAASRVPALGYGVSYAVGNILLALWGSVIIVLMHGTAG